MSLNSWLLAAAIGAQAFDITTTTMGLQRGCVETVWPTQNPWIIGSIKGTGTVVVSITLRGRPKTFRAVMTGLTVSGFVGGTVNLQCLR